jgi:hypothetical protein
MYQIITDSKVLTQRDVDFIVSAEQYKHFQQRRFSLQGEFPDGGNDHNRNISEYGLIV